MRPLDGVVLTTSPGYRTGFAVTAALFVLAAGWNVPAIIGGDYAWGPTELVGFPVVVLLALTSTVAAGSALRHAVWVDEDGLTLRVRMLLRTRAVPLTAPTTVALARTAPAPGATLVGTQRARVRRPGAPAVVISTPWVPHVAAFLALLGPALRENPALAPDEPTRRTIEQCVATRAPRTAG